MITSYLIHTVGSPRLEFEGLERGGTEVGNQADLGAELI